MSSEVIGALRAVLELEGGEFASGLLGAGTEVLGFADAMLRAESASQQAVNGLNLALANQGRLVGDTSKNLQDYAAALQNATTFDDELIMGAEGTLASFGMTEEQIKKTTGVAADFAAATGRDLPAAVELLGKAFAGNTDKLAKYGIVISDSIPATQKFDAALTQLSQRFGGAAAAETLTYAGQMEQVKNAFGDAEEAAGKFLSQLVNVGGGTSALKSFADWLQGFFGKTLVIALGEARAQFGEFISYLLARMAEGMRGLANIIENVPWLAKFAGPLRETADEMTSFSGELEKAAGALREESNAAASAAAGTEKFSNKAGAGAGNAKALADELKKSQEAWDKWVKAEAAAIKVHDDQVAAQRAVHDTAAAFELLGPSIDDVNFDMGRLALQFDRFGETVGKLSDKQLSDFISKMKTLVDQGGNNEEALKRYNTALDEQKTRMLASGQAVQFANGYWSRYSDVIGAVEGKTHQTTAATVTFEQHMRQTATTLQGISQVLGQVGSMLEALGVDADSVGARTVAAFANMANAAGTFAKTLGDPSANIFQKFSAGIGLATSIISSVVSVFSTPEWQKVAEDAGRNFGVTLDQAAAEAIAEDSDRIGDRYAATLLHLTDLFKAAGGVMAFGLDRAISATRDLFSQVERGILTTREASAAFDSSFAEIADAATANGGRVSAQFLELIELQRRFGFESKAVTEYLTGQANATISNLTTVIKGAVIEEQTAASGIATAIDAQFDALVANGATASEALKQLQPAIDALREKLDAAGLSGGAAFERLASMSALAADETAGPLIDSINAVGPTLDGLFNQGILNQEMFSGLAASASSSFEAIKEQGKDGPEALALIAPTLQTIWELQHQFGYQVDESTQALLDQAEAANLVGEAHMSAAEQEQQALGRIGDLLEQLLRGLHLLGPAAEDAARTMNHAFAGVHPPNINPGGGGDGEPGDDGFTPKGYREGGIGEFGAGGTAAILHNREAVIPFSPSAGENSLPNLFREMGGQLAAQLGGGMNMGGGGGGGDVYLDGQLVGHWIMNGSMSGTVRVHESAVVKGPR